MAGRSKRRKVPARTEVPMSAMIDIVFLLLVFFVATYKETLVEAHVAINVPTPATSKSSQKPILLEIYVLEEDTYTCNGKTMSIELLASTLAFFGDTDADQTVIIKVSPEARERTLIALLDVCNKVGLHQLNVLTLRNAW